MERSEHGSRWRGRERGRTLTRAQRSEGCVAGDCVEAGNVASLNLGGIGAQPRSGATRSPALSKGHIPSHSTEPVASVILYRNASFPQVRLRTSIQQAKPPKRGEVQRFSDKSRRRMMEAQAKLRRDELPWFVTLTYPNDFPEYREKYKRDLECFGRRLRRRWPLACILWKLEFKMRKSGANKGKVAPHFHLFVYRVPWEFPFRKEDQTWTRVALDTRKEF